MRLQKKKELIKYIYYLVLAIVLLFGLLVYVDEKGYFKIENVYVNGRELTRYEREMLLEGIADKIYKLETQKLLKRAQKLYKTYAVNIELRYPNKVLLEVSDGQIVGILRVSVLDKAITKKGRSKNGSRDKGSRDKGSRDKGSRDKGSRDKYIGLDKRGYVINKHIKSLSKHPIVEKAAVDVKGVKYNLGDRVQRADIEGVLFTLNILKEINKKEYEKIEKVKLYANNEEKNYLRYRGIKSKFYFGKELKLRKIFYMISFIKSGFMGTIKGTNSKASVKKGEDKGYDLRFVGLIVEKKS